MWLDDDTIAELLASADPDAVARGLAAFAARDADCDPPELDAPSAATMTAFVGGIPGEALDHFMALTVGRASDVAPPAADGGARLGEVIARGGDRQNGFEAALSLKVHPEAAAVSGAAVQRIGQLLGDLAPARHEPTAYFVSCLLDGKDPVRDAVFASLDRWEAADARRSVLDALAGYLSGDDRARLPRSESAGPGNEPMAPDPPAETAALARAVEGYVEAFLAGDGQPAALEGLEAAVEDWRAAGAPPVTLPGGFDPNDGPEVAALLKRVEDWLGGDEDAGSELERWADAQDAPGRAAAKDARYARLKADVRAGVRAALARRTSSGTDSDP